MRRTAMDSQQTTKDDIRRYLVTEAIDTEELPPEQLNEDLQFLTKAEERAGYQPDISKGIEDPALSRAIKALRLVNPFKGY